MEKLGSGSSVASVLKQQAILLSSPKSLNVVLFPIRNPAAIESSLPHPNPAEIAFFEYEAVL